MQPMSWVFGGRTNISSTLHFYITLQKLMLIYSSTGVRDLHRYPGPQKHHRLQSIGEAGSERGQAPVGRSVRDGLRHNVSPRHRDRHHCDRGRAGGRSAHPGGAGGAGGRNVHLHHIPGDPSA